MSQLPTNQLGDGRSIGSKSPGPAIEPTNLSEGAAQARLSLEKRDIAGDAIRTALQGLDAFDTSKAEEAMRVVTEERAEKAEETARRVKVERIQTQNSETLKLGIANIPQTGEDPQIYIDAVNAAVGSGHIDSGQGAALVTSARSQLDKVVQRESDLVVGAAMRSAKQGLIDPLQDFIRTRTTSDELTDWLNKTPNDIAALARTGTFAFVGNIFDADDPDVWTDQFFDVYDQLYANYRGVQEEASRLFGTMSEAERKTSNTNVIADTVIAGQASREAFIANSDSLDTLRGSGVIPNDLELFKHFNSMLTNFRSTIDVQLKSAASADVAAGLTNLTNLVQLGDDFYRERGSRLAHAEMKTELKDAAISMDRAVISEDMTSYDLGITRGDYKNREQFDADIENFAFRIVTLGRTSPEQAAVLNKQLQTTINNFNKEKASFDSVESYWIGTPRPFGASIDYNAVERSIIDSVFDPTVMGVLQQPEHPDYKKTRKAAMNNMFVQYTKYKTLYPFRKNFEMLGTLLDKVGEFDPTSNSNTPASIAMVDFAVNFALEGVENIGTGFYASTTEDTQASLDFIKSEMIISGNSKLVEPIQILSDIKATLDRTGSKTISERRQAYVDFEIDRTGDKNYFSLSIDRSTNGAAAQIADAVLNLGEGDVFGIQDMETFVTNNSKFMQAAIKTYKNIGALGPGNPEATLAGTMKSLTNRGFKVWNLTVAGGGDNDRVRITFDDGDQLPAQAQLAHITTQFKHLLKEEGVGMSAVVDNMIGDPRISEYILGRQVTEASREKALEELEELGIEFDFDFEGIMPVVGYNQHPSGGVPIIYYLEGNLNVPYPVYNSDGSTMRQTFDKFSPEVIDASPQDASLTEEQKVAAQVTHRTAKRRRHQLVGATTPGINHPKP